MRGQMLGQTNLIDLFGRRPLSEAVAERFHYATQLLNFFTNFLIRKLQNSKEVYLLLRTDPSSVPES